MKGNVMHIEDIKNLTSEERTEVFAKLNNKDLELLVHHAQVELQDREVRQKEFDEAFALQTARERSAAWK